MKIRTDDNGENKCILHRCQEDIVIKEKSDVVIKTAPLHRFNKVKYCEAVEN